MKLIKFISLLILLNILVFFSYGQSYDSISIIPGTGIKFNLNSIYINKSTISETSFALGISDQTNPDSVIEMYHDFINGETGISGTSKNWTQQIKFKNICFNFVSNEGKSNLKLNSIIILEHPNTKSNVNQYLLLGKEYPNIVDLFPSKEDNTIVNNGKITTIYQNGISFQFIKTGNNLFKLYFIQVYEQN